MVCTNIIHSLNLNVLGGCSSIGAVTPRLVDMVDEIWEEKEMRDSTQNAKQEVADQATQLEDFQGKEVGAAMGCDCDKTGDEDADQGIYLERRKVGKIGSKVFKQDHLEERPGFKHLAGESGILEIEKTYIAGEENVNMQDKSYQVEVRGGVDGRGNAEVSADERAGNVEEIGNTVMDVNCLEGRAGSKAAANVRPAHWLAGVQCAVRGSRRDFKDHIRAHGAEKLTCPRSKLTCPRPNCKKEFVSLGGFKLHVRGHDHDEKEKNKLKNIKNEIIKTRAVVVNQLKKTGAMKLKSMEAKLKSKEKRRVYTECEVEGCSKRYPPGCGYLRRREDHMRMKHGHSKLQCGECDATYFSTDGLNCHVKKAHRSGKNATKGDSGRIRSKDMDRMKAAVDKADEMSPIEVKVNEPEFEVLDMEIF